MSYPTYTDILERELAQHKAVIEQQKEVISDQNSTYQAMVFERVEQAELIETLAEALFFIHPSLFGDEYGASIKALATYENWRAK
jgi:hypothetical protein